MRSVASPYTRASVVALKDYLPRLTPLGYLLDHCCECLRGLERRHLAGGYDDCRLLGDIASGILSALLDDETTEASEVDIVSLTHSVLHCIHKSLYDLQYLLSV